MKFEQFIDTSSNIKRHGGMHFGILDESFLETTVKKLSIFFTFTFRQNHSCKFHPSPLYQHIRSHFLVFFVKNLQFSSSLSFQNLTRHNNCMLNQLLGSSEQQRRFKRQLQQRLRQKHNQYDPHPNYHPQDNSYQSSTPTHRFSSTYPDYPEPIIILPAQSRIIIHESRDSPNDSLLNIRHRLRQRDIYLPKIDTHNEDSFYSSLTGSQVREHSYDSRPMRIQTEGNQVEEIDRTLQQIQELSHAFKHQINRKYFRGRKSQEMPKHKNFDHLSRHKDYDSFIESLDRKHRKSNLQKGMTSIEPHSTDLPLNSALSDRQIQKPDNPEETDRPNKRTIDSTKNKSNRDTVIKLLRKVKNRGESLRIKINKYPSPRNT